MHLLSTLVAIGTSVSLVSASPTFGLLKGGICGYKRFLWKEKASCLPYGGVYRPPPPPVGHKCLKKWYWSSGSNCCVPEKPTTPKLPCGQNEFWSSETYSCVPKRGGGRCNNGDFWWVKKECCLPHGGIPAPPSPPNGYQCPNQWYWHKEKGCCVPTVPYVPAVPVCPPGCSWKPGFYWCTPQITTSTSLTVVTTESSPLNTPIYVATSVESTSVWTQSTWTSPPPESSIVTTTCYPDSTYVTVPPASSTESLSVSTQPPETVFMSTSKSSITSSMEPSSTKSIYPSVTQASSTAPESSPTTQFVQTTPNPESSTAVTTSSSLPVESTYLSVIQTPAESSPVTMLSTRTSSAPKSSSVLTTSAPKPPLPNTPSTTPVAQYPPYPASSFVPELPNLGPAPCSNTEFWWDNKQCCLPIGGVHSPPSPPEGVYCPSDWYWNIARNCCVPKSRPYDNRPPSCPVTYSWIVESSWCKPLPSGPPSCSNDEFWWADRECCLPRGGPTSPWKPPSGKTCPNGWSWGVGQGCCVPDLPPVQQPKCGFGRKWSLTSLCCLASGLLGSILGWIL